MMLKALALGLILSVAANVAARAEPLFDAYQALCVKTGAEAPATLAAADAAGWMPLPQPLLQQLSKAAAVDGADGRMKSDAAGIQLLIAGHKTMPIGPANVDVRFCAVATTAAVADALKSQLAAWAAVPPEPGLSATDRTGYAFTDAHGVHTVLTKPNDDQALALLRTGHVTMAFIQESKGLNLLAFAVPSI
ncbi:hypothetical protein [Phenylobacterium sp.]|uniref:hypothetical protein n=1 Tax=Phenylobacterium sp. TaxID=1871053 RepID=UPI00121DE85B|nr:hypothetical protein [Phenylobacterium sp.]THD50941.1 MAG: hypothetical protein E8A12_21675 [Phenylobacterium sp.]